MNRLKVASIVLVVSFLALPLLFLSGLAMARPNTPTPHSTVPEAFSHSNFQRPMARVEVASGECASALDLVFVIDTTGSMNDDINQVKAASTEIVNALAAQVSDFRIGVVSFEDFPDGVYGNPSCGDDVYHDVLNFSSDSGTITSGINSLVLRCGEDEPESDYSALVHTLQKASLGGWRDNTVAGLKRMVILITDAPPHDPEPWDGGHTLEDVRNAALAFGPGAIIYPILSGGSAEAEPYMQAIADATGGQMFISADASAVVAEIMNVLGTTCTSPVANAGGAYVGDVGAPVQFDAGGSTDPDGTIVLYRWDWDNDGVYDEETTDPTISHTWAGPFNGAVILQVVDNDGLRGTDVATVQIGGEVLSPALDLGSASGVWGGKTRIPITLKNVEGIQISATSNDIRFDTSVFDHPRVLIGEKAVEAGKSIEFHDFAEDGQPGLIRVGIAGLNNYAIEDGVVAWVILDIKNPTLKGDTELLNTPSAASPDGEPVTVTGANGVVTIVSLCGDCDNSEFVTINEVQAVINMYLETLEPQGCADMNGDGKIAINEVQLTIVYYLTIEYPEAGRAAVDGVVAATRPRSNASVGLAGAKGRPGETITIPITLKSRGNGVAAISNDLHYNTTLLADPKASLGPAGKSANKMVVTSAPSEGVFRIGVLGVNESKISDGEVVYVSFTIKDNARPGVTTVAGLSSISDPSGKALPLRAANGAAKVKILKKGTKK